MAESGCTNYCPVYIGHNLDYHGVVEADSSSSFHFVTDDKDDWDSFYSWDQTFENFGVTITYFIDGGYYTQVDFVGLYSKDLNSGGNIKKLGIRADSNVTMQCFFGPVDTEPSGYHEVIDMSSWDTTDTILANTKYMSHANLMKSILRICTGLVVLMYGI